ncbi:MAG: hypothetical protein GY826_21750 [Fuerstiella sp.]|nr:hypothetical protein [Fuerstiella sp.]
MAIVTYCHAAAPALAGVQSNRSGFLQCPKLSHVDDPAVVCRQTEYSATVSPVETGPFGRVFTFRPLIPVTAISEFFQPIAAAGCDRERDDNYAQESRMI